MGADELCFLLVGDMRGAAALRFSVDGHLVVFVRRAAAQCRCGSLDFPLDDDALESLGVEIGQHALEGGFFGEIPCTAAFAVAAERAQLKLSELGSKGGQVTLAADDARQGRHDHDGQQAGQRIIAAFSRPPFGNPPAQDDEFAQLTGSGIAARNHGILNVPEIFRQLRGSQQLASIGA